MQATAQPHTTLDVPVHVWFCAWAVAGVRTQYENVRAVAESTDGVDGVEPHFLEINPYKPGGVVERLPFLNNRSKGTLRSSLCAAPLFWQSPVDAIWTQTTQALFPELATRARLAGIPYVISIDATIRQIEAFAEYNLASRGTWQHLKHSLRDRVQRYCYAHAALVLPWSRWAADAMIAEYGLAPERVEVVPPGVDLRIWQRRDGALQRGPRPRLLFVGGDFARKGGPLLLNVYHTHLRDRCELHLVTRDSVDPMPGVYVHHDLGPNDPRLRTLYQTSDMLVLPTRADCFSLAALEAMASELPVIICPVGGIPEIVEHECSGYLVPVNDGAALRSAIEALFDDPARGAAMGARGRQIVEDRFDADKNARYSFQRIVELCAGRRRNETPTTSKLGRTR